jgi:hypothetical protein
VYIGNRVIRKVWKKIKKLKSFELEKKTELRHLLRETDPDFFIYAEKSVARSFQPIPICSTDPIPDPIPFNYHYPYPYP